MIGEFAVHIVGTSWSGVARVAGSLAKHSQLVVDQSDARAAHLSGKDGADQGSDFEERTKSRIDRFQASCLIQASAYQGRKWGCLSASDHIGHLLDPANAGSPAIDAGRRPQGKFNAIDYFACRFIGVPTIFVLRDGRGCIPAKIKGEGLPLQIAIARWRFSIYLLTRFARFAEKLWVVRMEDLVNNPDDEMQHICKFLDIEVEDSVVNSIRSEDVQRAFAPESPAVIEMVSQEPWFAQISDDLKVGGYLEP